MKEIPYRSFSLRTHRKNGQLKRPNVCQFELTFRCGLRCKHCYTDCYNRSSDIKKELSTEQIKSILDKVYLSGVIWLCFTGGDPLTRKDFPEIYSHAKKKGFIITLFTNAYSMSQKMARLLKRKPPFVIEVTLNAATKKTYEKISQVKGSFEKTKRGIRLILKEKLPLKIKTQVTQDNLPEIPDIKKSTEGWGLAFRPSFDLHARLNGDLAPCHLRVAPEEVPGFKKGSEDTLCGKSDKGSNSKGDVLFHCAAGSGDGIMIDPYGNMFTCSLLRKPAFNLLKTGVNDALSKLLPTVRNRKFTTDSKCNGCDLRDTCHWCPGRAYVEKGEMEKPIEYYCKLAHCVP